MAFEEETIGDWTVERLTRFLQQLVQENPPVSVATLTCDSVLVAVQLTVNDQVQFNNVQFTVGATGAASALPANPAGYFRVKDYTGQPMVIPYYNA